MTFDSLTQGAALPFITGAQPGHSIYNVVIFPISLTCTGSLVASLEGDLRLATAVSHPAILTLDPPPPGPGAGAAGGAAAAPTAPG